MVDDLIRSPQKQPNPQEGWGRFSRWIAGGQAWLRRAGFVEASGRVALSLPFIALASWTPLLLRLLHMREGGYEIRRFDWTGICGDVMIGMFVTLLLVLARRAGVFVFVFCVLLWGALNAGYYEFLRQFGSSFFLIHAGEMLHPTFVEGSGTTLTHPALMAGSILATGVFAWLAGNVMRPLRLRTVALIASALFIAVEVLPVKDNMTVWRTRDFVSANLRDVMQRVIATPGAGHAQASEGREAGLLPQPDLSGRPFLQAAGPRNVILVFVESISGGQIPSLARVHGVDSKLTMPRLDAIARANLSYSTFITHQKQSNRGLYAALCGDLPRLAAGIPKMSDIANATGKRCLPEILKDAGYTTLFMKSANSNYMLMGQFARKTGFERAYGEEGFDVSVPRWKWGLDDRSLYAGALAEIARLDQGNKPYFLSLFTSGTHHPYNVPETFQGAKSGTWQERAWAFADLAVDEFVSALQSRGYLDDTLLILTSDEATPIDEVIDRKEERLNGMTENWGYVIVEAPEVGAHDRIDTPYQQADMTLSILDYLGLGDKASPFTGRSLFRHYEMPRSFFYANVYKRRIYQYDEGRSLSICDETLSTCRVFDASTGTLFGHSLAVTDDDGRPSNELRAVRAISVRSPVAMPRS